MKKFVAVAVVGVGLLAGCSSSVDRDGTRDKLIDQIKTELGVDVDKDCVDGVFDGYSDDEIEAIYDSANKGDATAENVVDFFTKVGLCVSATT
jgi:hypothetical protein